MSHGDAVTAAPDGFDVVQCWPGFTIGGVVVARYDVGSTLEYSELIVFEDKAAMDRFENNQFEFGANASAIIAKTGAAANARFVDGIAVFVRPVAGAMAEASVGGQRVTYVAK